MSENKDLEPQVKTNESLPENNKEEKVEKKGKNNEKDKR